MQCESHYEELVPMGETAGAPTAARQTSAKQFSVFAGTASRAGRVSEAEAEAAAAAAAPAAAALVS